MAAVSRAVSTQKGCPGFISDRHTTPGQNAGRGQQQRQKQVLPFFYGVRGHGVGVKAVYPSALLHGAGLGF